MSSRILLAIATLALGTALTAIPAIAQDNGAGATNAQQYKYPIGRPMNDGGYATQQNNGARRSARTRINGTTNPPTAATAQNYRSPIGRSMDDGGFPQEQAQYNGAQREQRTGSAENMEHAQARSAELGGTGPTNYAYDRDQRGSYYDYASGPSYAGGPGPMPGAIEACEARASVPTIRRPARMSASMACVTAVRDAALASIISAVPAQASGGHGLFVICIARERHAAGVREKFCWSNLLHLKSGFSGT